MSKARDLADLISTGGVLGDGVISTSEITDITATASELNLLDGATVTTSELNKLAGTTATTSDFDKLSNVTASATELNYMTGATSSIQDQLDNISVTSGSLTKTFASGESATITLAQSISPAPVVSVTKEVAQTGQSSKGAWDVNATASNYTLHNTAYDTTITPTYTSTGTAYSATEIGSINSYYNGTAGINGLNARAMSVSSDGTKAIVFADGATMHSLSLSTAFDISTASVTISNSSGWPTNNYGGYVKEDGTKVWVIDYGSSNLYEYSLSTAWDVSTKSLIATHSANLPSQIIDAYWKPDGTKLWVPDYSSAIIYQFTATTPFDFSTTGVPYSYQITSVSNSVMDIQFNNDGTELFVSINGNSTYNVLKLSLNTAWDLSGTVTESVHVASMSSKYSSLALGGDNLGFYEYYDNGKKLFFAAYGSDTIYQATIVDQGPTTLVLGTGSFASTDVGKRIQGNGGDVILTSTAGAYDTTGGSDFTDTSTIASGSWTMHGLKSAGASSGLTISSLVNSTAGTVDVFNDNVSTMALYKLDGNGTESGGNYSSTVNSGAFTASGGPVLSGGYWSVDSTNANILTNWNQPETSAWMASFWMKSTATSFTVNNRLMDFREHTSGKGTTISWENDSQFHFIVRAGIYGYSKPLGGSSTILNGNWHHIVVGTTNGQEPVAYIDGVLITATSAMVRSDSQETIGVKIGAGFGGPCIGTSFDQVRFFNRELSSSEVATLYAEGTGSATISVPTSQYHIAVTNASGQIDSASWTDINSMTADQSLGDGEAYYAVSTDDRTTWSVAKASDGVRPIVRDNAGTWQYNSDGGNLSGYSLSSIAYDSVSTYIGTQVTAPFSFDVSSDGLNFYVLANSGTVFQYTLSTAWDASSASYSSKSFAAYTGGVGTPNAVRFKPDGTKMYIVRKTPDVITQYTLSTAWDVSTASEDATSFTTTSQESAPESFYFKSDGTKLYVVGSTTGSVHQYSLSSAWDVSTASYDSVSFSLSPLVGNFGITFNSDGSKFFIVNNANDTIYEYSLTTAWDLSSASSTGVSYATTSEEAGPRDIAFKSDGTKMYLIGTIDDSIDQYSTSSYSYGTSTTWTNSTTNDEFYALQQALGATAFNRMDKTQLDAVADGSHFTLGNTLDLMIALKQNTASASLPTSDGVTINYDAEALIQGAVLGTDYDFRFPANNQVEITSNAAQNLKIRVV